MGRWVWLVVFSLLTAACGGNGSAAPTSSASTSSSSTVATIATTTTTESIEVCEPEAIEGRGRIWEAGCSYTASSFLVPITFAGVDGWTSLGGGNEWVALKHDANGDGDADVTLTVFAHNEDSAPDVILDEILSFDGVTAVSDETAMELAGASALTVDVVAEEKIPVQSDSDGCTQPSGTAFFFQTTPGYVLFQLPAGPGPGSFGIPACYQSRVWVFEVEGFTITAIGVTPTVETFDEYMPILEDFLANNVTFGETDG